MFFDYAGNSNIIIDPAVANNFNQIKASSVPNPVN